MTNIDFSDFTKVDIRVGEILEVHDFPEAHKPAYKLSVDFGHDIGIKKSSAQITVHYTKEQLIGKKILAVVNFEPKQIGPFISEVLVLGVPDINNDIVLIAPTHNDAEIGGRLH